MLTEQQNKIYQGLKQISEAIADLYLDGTKLIDPLNTLNSKANLLAHLAREIDGGLRDIFIVKENTLIQEKDICEQDEIKESHRESILKAVGTSDPDNKLAKKWYTIAKNFHKFAHRGKLYQPLREPQNMIDLWRQYEEVLIVFIGSFYSISNRIDVFIKNLPPVKNQLLLFKRVISSPQAEFYFFQNLDNIAWLDTLIKENFFEISSAPKINEEGTLIEWYPLRYLLNISSTDDTGALKKIAAILNDITQAYIEEKILLYTYSINTLTDIIVNLKNYPFTNQTKAFFKKINAKAIQPAWNIYSGNLVEKGTDKYLRNSDKESIENLLDYVFGYSVSRIPGGILMDIQLADEVQIDFFIDDYLVSEFSKNYGKEIVKLIGTSAIKICLNKIKNIKKERPFSFSSMDFPSIEVTNQSHAYNIWETELVNFIRDYSCYLAPDELKELTAHLIESDIRILRRLGLNFIRINFVLFQEFWWKFISKYNIDNINTHEPYTIIQQTSAAYNSEQIKLVIDWIEKIKEYEVNTDNYSATDNRYYNIRKWLLAFDETAKNTDDYLIEKVSYYDSLNNWSFEHPEFDSYYTSYIGESIPKDAEQFQLFSIEEQIAYINDFQPDHFNNITERGLSQLNNSSC